MKSLVEYISEAKFNRNIEFYDLNIVSESLKDPKLIELAKYRKKFASKSYYNYSFGGLFSQFGVEWDKITESDWETITDIEKAQEVNMLNYTYSLDDIINKRCKSENKNAVILLGGNFDKEIPVETLAKEYNFNFNIYNKSSENLSLSSSVEFFKTNISQLHPEGILLHLGENDISLFQKDSAAFDNYYLTLIDEIKNVNKKCRIALLSVNNSENNKTISLMNAHINAIAQTEKADFINLENTKLWNPESTKAACNFAYSMGLNIRKPLRDVAEILYSYAYHNLSNGTKETLAG